MSKSLHLYKITRRFAIRFQVFLLQNQILVVLVAKHQEVLFNYLFCLFWIGCYVHLFELYVVVLTEVLDDWFCGFWARPARVHLVLVREPAGRIFVRQVCEQDAVSSVLFSGLAAVFILVVEVLHYIEAVLVVQINEEDRALAPPQMAERYCSVLEGSRWESLETTSVEEVDPHWLKFPVDFHLFLFHAVLDSNCGLVVSILLV